MRRTPPALNEPSTGWSALPRAERRLASNWAVALTLTKCVICQLPLQLVEMARSATYFVLLAALALVFNPDSDAHTLGTYGGYCGNEVSRYMKVSSSDPCVILMFLYCVRSYGIPRARE